MDWKKGSQSRELWFFPFPSPLLLFHFCRHYAHLRRPWKRKNKKRILQFFSFLPSLSPRSRLRRIHNWQAITTASEGIFGLVFSWLLKLSHLSRLISGPALLWLLLFWGKKFNCKSHLMRKTSVEGERGEELEFLATRNGWWIFSRGAMKNWEGGSGVSPTLRWIKTASAMLKSSTMGNKPNKSLSICVQKVTLTLSGKLHLLQMSQKCIPIYRITSMHMFRRWNISWAFSLPSLTVRCRSRCQWLFAIG